LIVKSKAESWGKPGFLLFALSFFHTLFVKPKVQKLKGLENRELAAG
jgi:hypothetical protein